MSKFLKKEEVKLINGGYLSDKDGNPVNNSVFVQAQLEAEFVVTFANMAKGKDFKGKKADSLADLKLEVEKALYRDKDVTYIDKPKEVERPTHSALAKEAMAFMDYGDKLSKVEKVNKFMQKFNGLNDFETFGLFFDSGIVKLNRIYTIQEIKDAVMEAIELL